MTKVIHNDSPFDENGEFWNNEYPPFNSEGLRRLFDDAFTEGQKEMARPIDFPIGEYERSPFGYEPAPIKQHSDEALIGLERYWHSPRVDDSGAR